MATLAVMYCKILGWIIYSLADVKDWGEDNLFATMIALWFFLSFSLQDRTRIITFNSTLKYNRQKVIYKMINDTEDFCLLESWTQNISMNEVNSEYQLLLLEDPYDSIWLKIVAILFYFIGLINSAIMLAFINYENEHHGNFRTVINQLLSNLYAVVSFYL